MNERIFIGLILTAYFLAGCSTAELGPVDIKDFDEKVGNLTGTTVTTKEPSQEVNSNNITTEFWPEDPKFKMTKGVVRKINPDGSVIVNEHEKISLIGTQLYESRTDDREYFYIEPKEVISFMEKELINKTVYVEYNPNYENENSDVVPAYIWIGNNEKLINFNALMISEGYVMINRQEGLSIYDKSFKALENKAIRDKKGIWDLGNKKD